MLASNLLYHHHHDYEDGKGKHNICYRRRMCDRKIHMVLSDGLMNGVAAFSYFLFYYCCFLIYAISSSNLFKFTFKSAGTSVLFIIRSMIFISFIYNEFIAYCIGKTFSFLTVC
jgi:hypothetical protein